jgi:hypothetical protein
MAIIESCALKGQVNNKYNNMLPFQGAIRKPACKPRTVARGYVNPAFQAEYEYNLPGAETSRKVMHE